MKTCIPFALKRSLTTAVHPNYACLARNNSHFHLSFQVMYIENSTLPSPLPILTGEQLLDNSFVPMWVMCTKFIGCPIIFLSSLGCLFYRAMDRKCVYQKKHEQYFSHDIHKLYCAQYICYNNPSRTSPSEAN